MDNLEGSLSKSALEGQLGGACQLGDALLLLDTCRAEEPCHACGFNCQCWEISWI